MSTNETDVSEPYSLTYSLKFAVLISLQIPSILISLLIFVYFGIYRRTRIKDHHYSILLLLTINFFQVVTDLPMPMSFFRLNGIVQPTTSAYCIWWIWYEFSLNTTNGILMAWISIERHLLIFHSNSLQNVAAWKRKLFRTIPLVFCTLWGPLYYMVAVIISPMCVPEFNFSSLLCGLPCYLFTNWGTFDLFFDVISPVLIIFLCNLALFLRVVYQNMVVVGRVGNNNWKRQRKLAFQLGLISFIYLIVWIPISLIQLGRIYIDPTFLLDYLDTFNFLIYIVPLILPMICLLSMPEILKQLKIILFPTHRGAVIPAHITQTRQNNLNHLSKTNTASRI